MIAFLCLLYAILITCFSTVGFQLVRFLIVELTHSGLNPKFDMYVVFIANYSFSGGRCHIDNETLLMTDFINLKIKPAQSFRCAHMSMSVRTYIYSYVYEYIHLYCASQQKLLCFKHDMPVDQSVSRILSFSAANYCLPLNSTPSSVGACFWPKKRRRSIHGYVFGLQFPDLMRTCQISLSLLTVIY
jgi:hypothetical protein